jgi:hypothetical protein
MDITPGRDSGAERSSIPHGTRALIGHGSGLGTRVQGSRPLPPAHRHHGLPSRELFADDAMSLLTGRAETPP